jgi:hypothetical protein
MQKKDEERMAQEKKVKVLDEAKKQQEEGRLLAINHNMFPCISIG